MKITLISTDADSWSLGIRAVSAVLRNAGHSTQIIFLPAEAPQYCPNTLAELNDLTAGADLAGISCLSRGYGRARQIANYLRTRKKLVVWGGVHASLNPRECAEDADMVCRGEGEEAICELAELIEAGKDWHGVRNLAFRHNGHTILNPLRPPVLKLDDLPHPDFDNPDEFHLTRGRLVQTDPMQALPRAQGLAIGSRGCAYNCTYCCNRQLKELYTGNGIYIRKMSPARYVDQIENLHRGRLRNASDFFLVDEDFFMRSAPEIREFAALYQQRIGIPFECMASATRVTEEKLACLSAAGLWRIRVGVESGSERTKQTVFERRISNTDVLRASRIIASHPEVVAAYFFINGNPYEEQADLLATLGLMADLPVPYYSEVFNLVFFPGSRLYQRAVADGVIHGIEDSASELHYRAGFEYRKHAWKKKNLYLNTLIYLAEGKASRYRLGLLPRGLLAWLTRPGVIQWAEVRPAISHSLAALKSGQLSMRKRAGAVLRWVMRDPAGIYNVPRYLQKLFLRSA